MDVLTEPEITEILQCLATCVTALEQELSAPPFYLFVLLAQELAAAKKTGMTLAHLRTCLGLAQRMQPIRDVLIESGGRWTPLHTVSELLHGEATRLSTLYGVVRPSAIPLRRTLQQTFRTAFTQATGHTYDKYGFSRTAKERTTITAFWEDALRTALAQFQTGGTVEALDAVMACLPAWADRQHERWSRTRAWREPSAQDVLALVTAYLGVCDACLERIAALARAAVTQAPVVDPAQITQDVEQQHGEEVRALRAQLSAFPLTKDTPKAQQAQLRKDKAQLTQTLQGLLRAQAAEIARRVTHHANARHKLERLVQTTSGYQDTVLRKVGKASMEVLPRMIWIYDFDRQGDDAWRAAKREAKRVVRQVRQAHAPAGAGTAG